MSLTLKAFPGSPQCLLFGLDLVYATTIINKDLGGKKSDSVIALLEQISKSFDTIHIVILLSSP